MRKEWRPAIYDRVSCACQVWVTDFSSASGEEPIVNNPVTEIVAMPGYWAAKGFVMPNCAFVNGSSGGLAVKNGRPFAVLGFGVSGGKIVEIDVWTDPERLGRLGLEGILRRPQ